MPASRPAAGGRRVSPIFKAITDALHEAMVTQGAMPVPELHAYITERTGQDHTKIAPVLAHYLTVGHIELREHATFCAPAGRWRSEYNRKHKLPA